MYFSILPKKLISSRYSHSPTLSSLPFLPTCVIYLLTFLFYILFMCLCRTRKILCLAYHYPVPVYWRSWCGASARLRGGWLAYAVVARCGGLWRVLGCRSVNRSRTGAPLRCEALMRSIVHKLTKDWLTKEKNKKRRILLKKMKNSLDKTLALC